MNKVIVVGGGAAGLLAAAAAAEHGAQVTVLEKMFKPEMCIRDRFFDDRVKTSTAESSDWYDQRPYRRQCVAGWLAAGSEGWFRYYNSCVWHQYYFAVDF